jgi:hypothetical protein
LIPAARQAASRSSSQSVGFASIVISSSSVRAPNRAPIASIARPMQSGRHSEGVPPPR